MEPAEHLFFPPFHLDLVKEKLWCAAACVALRPRAFRLLRYLAEHPQRLITQEELLQAVWQRRYVSDGLLRAYIRELRRVLGDDARAPRFIETAARRGYRFLAPVTPTRPALTHDLQHPTARFIGRAAELARLHGALTRVLAGERQVVFATGEPGIGKTALVDAFLVEIAGVPELRSARGQCIEHYGAGEAYLPVLEALGSLARGAKGEALIALLRRQAPTWLMQLPAFLEEAEREALSRQLFGATQERMAREMAGALEALSAEGPLVLWLEDLHWSDPSTLDLLAMLARRREPARLLVVGTYRPAEAIVRAQPLRALKQELQGHGQCAELPLGFLSLPEVAQYLTLALGGTAPQAGWAQVIHRQSDGNPLFMVAMVEELAAQGVIGGATGPADLPEWDLPAGLRQFLQHQLERLRPEEQQVLETASIAGMEFSPALVAAALETDVLGIEAHCEALASRQHFLRSHEGYRASERRGSERYRFRHAVYRDVLQKRLSGSRRRRLHRRVGEWKERAAGERAREIAAELAVHFESGGDTPRAVHYLGQAAEQALRRVAHREAVDHLTQALALLETLPETPERTQHELRLQVALSVALAMTKGYAAPEVERVYSRARALSQQVEESPELFPLLYGICRFYVLRAEFQTAYEQAEQLLTLAQHAEDPGLLHMANMMLTAVLLFRGEFVRSRAHLKQTTAPYGPQQRRSFLFLYGDDPEVCRLSHGGWTLWYSGYPDQALESIDAAIMLARELAHPFNLVFALGCAAQLHLHRREGQTAQAQAETVIALANEHGFPHFLAYGSILRGGALAEQGHGEEGIAQIRQGLTVCQAIGHVLGRTYFCSLLAEAHGAAGQVEEGLKVLDEALEAAHKTGERLHEAEIYRLRGELMLRGGQAAVEAEACFHKAIDTARRQSAKSLELRALMSFCRLREVQGRTEEAREQLAEVYGWFTEGFNTKDLQEARALLERLG